MLAFHVGHHSCCERLEKEDFTACGSLGVEGWRLVRKTSLGRGLGLRKNLEEVKWGKGQPTHTLLIPIISFRLSPDHAQGHSWWNLREDGEWWICGKLEKSNSHFAKIPCGSKEKAFQADSTPGSHPRQPPQATSWRGRVIELGVRGLGPSPGAVIFLLWSVVSNLTSLRLGFHTSEVREQDKVICNILWSLMVIILNIYTKHLGDRESWNSFNTWYWEEPWFTTGPCQRFLNSSLLKHQN